MNTSYYRNNGGCPKIKKEHLAVFLSRFNIGELASPSLIAQEAKFSIIFSIGKFPGWRERGCLTKQYFLHKHLEFEPPAHA